MTRYIVALLTILLLIATGGALLYRGNAANARAERDAAVAAQTGIEAERDNLQGVLTLERARANAMAGIAAQYERDKTDALLAADRTVADLRAGTARLRQHWQGCVATTGLSAATARAAKLDAGAELRNASAGRIAGAADRCDAQVRGLQRVVVEDRALGTRAR